MEELMSQIEFESGFCLPSRVFLAPMEGVMGHLFRRATLELGLIDACFAPFIGVGGGDVPSKGAIRRRLKGFLDCGLSLVAQVLGRSPEPIAECSVRLAELGVRAVNLNFACPSTTVAGGGGGGAMLGSPELLEATVRAVRTACPGVSVSVKLRSGLERADETGGITRSVCDGGADFIIFHYRTVSEGYREAPGRLERIECAVKAAGAVPLFGNGDIESMEEAEGMCAACGCAGAAVGRGFLKDPFIFRRGRGGGAVGGVKEGRHAFLLKMLEFARGIGEGGAWGMGAFLEAAALALKDSEAGLLEGVRRMPGHRLLGLRSFDEVCAKDKLSF